MTVYFRYLRYVLRHKHFVFQEGRKLRVSLWQLLIHDWSKFLPDEFLPYARNFYGDNAGEGLRAIAEFGLAELAPWGYFARDRFEAAWLKHIHRSPHHWQHWVLREDSGDVKVLPMPDRYRREMLADWRGASRAIHGRDETATWYAKTAVGRVLHPDTQAWVERELGIQP